MDLEARSLQPSQKSALLAKLREYKSDLNNLKKDVKRAASSVEYINSREELMESGLANHAIVCLSSISMCFHRFLMQLFENGLIEGSWNHM